MKTLGAYVREYRKNNKLTQEALGEMCSISGGTISTIETGSFCPTDKTLSNLAEGIGVPYNKLAAMPIKSERKKRTKQQPDPGAAMLMQFYVQLSPEQRLRLLQQAMELAVGFDMRK